LLAARLRRGPLGGDVPSKASDVGNLFAVPLADGSFTLGQVVGREADALNSITCAFYRSRTTADALRSVEAVPDQEDLIAVQFVTKELLTRRMWKVIGNYPVSIPRTLMPHEDKRHVRWVGARIHGAGIIRRFLNAYFGLEAWNQMKDPAYFDHLLLRPELRPSHPVLR
jgi:hypothetical protein